MQLRGGCLYWQLAKFVPFPSVLLRLNQALPMLVCGSRDKQETMQDRAGDHPSDRKGQCASPVRGTIRDLRPRCLPAPKGAEELGFLSRAKWTQVPPSGHR